MTVFVLIHGAWGGAHGFRKVRGPLRAAGHEVFTPILTGIGERAHLASPQVCLTTHVTDVVNTIWYEDSATSSCSAPTPTAFGKAPIPAIHSLRSVRLPQPRA